MSIQINNILEINEVKNSIMIKFVQWRVFYDNRLTYKDLKHDSNLNKLTDEEQEILWRPRITFFNLAKPSDYQYFTARRVHSIERNDTNAHLQADITYNNNVNLYDGSEHIQNIKVEFTTTWMCNFDMRRYPFDTQICTMEFFDMDSQSVDLVPDKLTFTGPLDLTQYFVHDYWMCSATLDNGEEGIKVILSLGRPLMGTLLTVFIPTIILIVIGHMSKVFEEDYVDMVIQVNLTGLLVLATL